MLGKGAADLPAWLELATVLGTCLWGEGISLPFPFFIPVSTQEGLWKPLSPFAVPQQLTGVCQSLLCPLGCAGAALAARRSCHNKGVVVAVDRNADELLGV